MRLKAEVIFRRYFTALLDTFSKVMVLETVGLPSEAVATILSVDWLLDRCSSVGSCWWTIFRTRS